jgi:hypothetical protein
LLGRTTHSSLAIDFFNGEPSAWRAEGSCVTLARLSLPGDRYGSGVLGMDMLQKSEILTI